jgi:hypothetical protein
MKERPILFSGPMVQALLEGRKTQTRRVAKGRPAYSPNATCAAVNPFVTPSGTWQWYDRKPRIGKRRFLNNPGYHGDAMCCPYGVPGDLLWVKETHRRWTGCGAAPATFKVAPDGDPYKAICYIDNPTLERYERSCSVRTVCSIHMPRWASRITLEIVSVRVERVESITEEDAVAEGFARREHFLHTFYVLNKRAPNGSDPWVWVVAFKRVGQN